MESFLFSALNPKTLNLIKISLFRYLLLARCTHIRTGSMEFSWGNSVISRSHQFIIIRCLILFFLSLLQYYAWCLPCLISCSAVQPRTAEGMATCTGTVMVTGSPLLRRGNWEVTGTQRVTHGRLVQAHVAPLSLTALCAAKHLAEWQGQVRVKVVAHLPRAARSGQVRVKVGTVRHAHVAHCTCTYMVVPRLGRQDKVGNHRAGALWPTIIYNMANQSVY